MKGAQTPWGPAQSEREIAPGIVGYSTASHGGIKLSAGRLSEFKKLFPGRQTFAGLPWFEEDCDWALVVLAFPHEFDSVAQVAAVRTVAWIKEPVPASYWATEAGQVCKAAADAAAERRAA